MTDYNIDYIIKQLGDHYSDDITKNRESLLKIIQINTDLGQVLFDAKIKIDSWEYYFEVLIEKIIHTSLSIIKLSEGYKFSTYKEKLDMPMIDSPSMFILTRSILECYLTLHYIFISDLPKPERFFRFKLWQISGLIARQNVTTPKTKEFEQLKETEKKLIEKLKTEIEADQEFNKLTKPQIDKLKKYGLPRLDSWSTLINKCDLKDSYFADMYSLFSNYAHSEFLSTIQLKQSTRNLNDSINCNRILVAFSIVRMINALIADWLKKSFKSVEITYNMMPNDYQNTIKIWSEIAKKTCP